MKTIVLQILWLQVIGLLFSSCEEKLEPYSNPNDRIAFVIDPQSPEINFSFAYLPDNVTESIVEVSVTAIGFVRDYNREISVRQVLQEGRNDAIAGTHYLAFDDPSMSEKLIISKEATGTNIPIKLYRTPELKDDTYTLELELVENSFFKSGYTNAMKRTVTVCDFFTKPLNWTNAVNYYFGTYSHTRHMVMNEAAAEYDQIINDEWIDGLIDGYTVDMAEIEFWVGCFKQKLHEINAERASQGLDKLKDENNNYVTFN